MSAILSRQGNVVDSEDHLNRLAGQLDGAGADKQRLHDALAGRVLVLTTHDTNTTTLDAHTDVRLAFGVTGPELCDDLDAVQTSVLGKCNGNQLQSVSIRFPADAVGVCCCGGDLGQVSGDSHLRGTTTRQKRALLDKAANDTHGVVQAALGFVENELVGTAGDDRNSLRGGGVCVLDDFDSSYWLSWA